MPPRESFLYKSSLTTIFSTFIAQQHKKKTFTACHTFNKHQFYTRYQTHVIGSKKREHRFIDFHYSLVTPRVTPRFLLTNNPFGLQCFNVTSPPFVRAFTIWITHHNATINAYRINRMCRLFEMCDIKIPYQPPHPFACKPRHAFHAIPRRRYWSNIDGRLLVHNQQQSHAIFRSHNRILTH